MPNTCTQLYIQMVFAVKFRENLIPQQHKEEIHKYITGIVQKKQNKMLAINCMPDHIHIFVGLHPAISISELVKSIKIASGDLIRDKKWVKKKFLWQDGFGAFSYSHSDIDKVIKYILNQEEHHRKKTFKEEYLEFLQQFEVEYDDKYLFEFYEYPASIRPLCGRNE